MKTITIGMIPDPTTEEQMKALLPDVTEVDGVIAVTCVTDSMRASGHHLNRFETGLEISWRRNRFGANHRTEIIIDADTGRVRAALKNQYLVLRDGEPIDPPYWTDLVWAYLAVLELGGSQSISFSTVGCEFDLTRMDEETA